MSTALAPRPPSVGGSSTFKRGSVITSSASESVEVQTPLKIGDQILIFSQEGQGYVYCEVSRYVCVCCTYRFRQYKYTPSAITVSLDRNVSIVPVHSFVSPRR